MPACELLTGTAADIHSQEHTTSVIRIDFELQIQMQQMPIANPQEILRKAQEEAKTCSVC